MKEGYLLLFSVFYTDTCTLRLLFSSWQWILLWPSLSHLQLHTRLLPDRVCIWVYSVSQKKCIILLKMLLLGPPIRKMHSVFFPGSVCVLSTCTNFNDVCSMHTLHIGIFFVHVVFFKCARLIFFFLTMCTDHRSTTRHLILDLFFLEVLEDVLYVHTYVTCTSCAHCAR